MKLIRKIFNKVPFYFGRESASYILSLRRESAAINLDCDQCDVVTSPSVAQGVLGGLRIENRLYQKWLAEGSRLLVLKTGTIEPSPRGWIHFNGPRVISGLKCHYNDRSAWIGPAFVPEKFRGNGYHKILIEHRIKESFQNYDVDMLITGINIGNVPSIRNCLQCGFSICGLISSRRFLFWTVSKKLLYSNELNKYLIVK